MMAGARPRSSALALVVVMVAASGCKTSSSSGGGSTKPTTPPPKVVGNVTRIGNPNATFRAKPAHGGDALTALGILKTDASGLVDFDLLKKVHDCKVRKASGVKMQPSPTVLLEYVSGTTWCSTDPDPDPEVFVTSTKAMLKLADPAFGVRVDAAGTTVMVGSGFVEVSSVGSGGSDAKVVGPFEQVAVPADGSPGDIILFTPDAEQQGLISEVQGGLPAPDFGPPDPSSSPTLGRVFDAGVLRVSMPAGSPDDATTSFVKSFLDFLAASWGLRLELCIAGIDQCSSDLTGGTEDLLVTGEPPTGTDAIFLFTDDTGQPWTLALAPDDGFHTALAGFLTAALQSGRYGTIYQGVFGNQPDYAPFSQQLGLTG